MRTEQMADTWPPKRQSEIVLHAYKHATRPDILEAYDDEDEARARQDTLSAEGFAVQLSRRGWMFAEGIPVSWVSAKD